MKLNKYQHINDEALLQEFYADGNTEWIGILLERYTILLLGTCMKYLKNQEAAKDAVQQIFLKVMTELPKYKVQYFKSWIYMIARNYCLMQLRDKKITYTLQEEAPLLEAEGNLAELLEKEKLLQCIENALDDLNEEQKKCITLFYLEKKSYRTIAAITGYSILQVKSHIQNGKRNLKLLVEKKQQHTPSGKQPE
ncbi:MAG: sigma-70 family RNA polymerase sigma factor [Hydrotalea flava]|uniref:RNA polymerase sigma factor n=1 Tax=Hydrotalea TaxID=1004300 RepID=UPI000943562A|nr:MULTISPECIES: sigma-70 family RNA polymerase sigma factor [Hydrotalea]MBY0348011.1 sigma-70 family RNA polymerase sigma factor [Hydrotalea flava]RWZ89608.1 MAG: sigma-70 family RNA polymerase sigma factor [Hydrotalea sp. AMD]NIM34445.1 sigma-70 family RNA polymerase sigma factor [Hydrotalea flava]NIM37276.1 sigma-70 family RNA polymerase sigma factor [Hydrotalea flava]NIN02464.1 sigma-70 family RNA polymerase sigma factor [Hydrotalea flava]